MSWLRCQDIRNGSYVIGANQSIKRNVQDIQALERREG